MDGGADSCSGRTKVQGSIDKASQKCIDVNAGGIYVNARNKTPGWLLTRTVNAGNDTAPCRVEIEGRCFRGRTGPNRAQEALAVNAWDRDAVGRPKRQDMGCCVVGGK